MPLIVVYCQRWKEITARRDKSKKERKREKNSNQGGLIRWHFTPLPSFCAFSASYFCIVCSSGSFYFGKHVFGPFLMNYFALCECEKTLKDENIMKRMITPYRINKRLYGECHTDTIQYLVSVGQYIHLSIYYIHRRPVLLFCFCFQDN